MYTVTCNEDNKGQLCKLHGQMTGKRLCFEFPNGITTMITKGACPNSYIHVNFSMDIHGKANDSLLHAATCR